MSQAGKNPKKQTLEDLKAQLQGARPVIVDSSGQLHVAGAAPAASADPQMQQQTGGTRVKPSRWF